MQHIVKIKSIEKITPDVLQIVTEKPVNYIFKPGQATEVSINRWGWMDEKRPFTFTSIPNDVYLEFTVKTYPTHQGVTHQFLQLRVGDELLVHDVFGSISYQGEGVFIAGGAGVTPFISILRQLQAKQELSNNKLIFANKTKADIILEDEFSNAGYLDRYFYVCGPPPMMSAVEKQLKQLGVIEKYIVKESF